MMKLTTTNSLGHRKHSQRREPVGLRSTASCFSAATAAVYAVSIALPLLSTKHRHGGSPIRNLGNVSTNIRMWIEGSNWNENKQVTQRCCRPGKRSRQAIQAVWIDSKSSRIK
ncbi:uncharacterized protein LOC111258659 isoform X1 [Varroa jacobsoni]|uniref:uncharacterized protein LOC111258659 isoform X1 n=1 Tax=Varroa jacobsoni TaxID=62625 RepID=UPI000BF34227|nr:uncharacterized protein LOC111258659 isoform X1 [Varroa jacobsoni]